VSSIRIAEAAKVIENVQRDINIALEKRQILEAAVTKWNFHYYPPGLAGRHCIGALMARPALSHPPLDGFLTGQIEAAPIPL
jgi:hypothetical protein